MGPGRYRCALLAMYLILLVLPEPASAQGNFANGLRNAFPELNGRFHVIDRSKQSYNCVAHTLGLHNQWIDPKTGPANAPFSFMDQLYGSQGYQRTPALSLNNDPRLQRVAVYATKNPDGSIKQITHTALQGSDGSWTSKLGQLPLIRHVSPYAVDGPMYGVPVATYVRPLANQAPNNARNGLAMNTGLPPMGRVEPLTPKYRSKTANPAVNNKGPKNGGFLSGGFQNAGRNLGGNAPTRHVNGGIHGGPLDLEAVASALTKTGGAFAGASIRINGGLHIHGGGFTSAFRNAGRGPCAADSMTANNGGFAGNNLAKNAGNSLNALRPGNIANNLGNSAARAAPRTLAYPAANAPRNLSRNNGPLASAFRQAGARCGNEPAGAGRISAANAGILGNVKSIPKYVANNRSPQNVGSAKTIGNTLTTVLNNNACVKNVAANANRQNAGAGKFAGNTLNALLPNQGCAKNSGASLTSRNDNYARAPGASVGNNNILKVGTRAGNGTGACAKATGPLPLNSFPAKNAGNALNIASPRNLGSANNIARVGNTKNVAANAPGNNACAKASGQFMGPIAGNATAAKNGPGNLVSNKKTPSLPANLANAKNVAQNQRPITIAKNGPGNLVGNKKTPSVPTNLGNAKNIVQNQRPPATAKNGAGNVGGNKTAIAKNIPPANVNRPAGNNPNLAQAKSANKTAFQPSVTPAVARNAAMTQANFKPSQVKAGAMPGRTAAMNMPTQMRAPIKVNTPRQATARMPAANTFAGRRR